MTVKVILLDDEELVRRGIRMILNAEPDIEVVAEAGDGSTAVGLVAEHRPDVVLTDIQMPRVGGLEVARQLAALTDPPAVGVLTTFDVDEYVYAALQHGAAGFLLKDTLPRELTDAVRVLARGEAMLSPSITIKLLAVFATGAVAPQARSRMGELTARERAVAMAVAQGHSNSEIATELLLSQSTVKVHVSRIMTKLGAANRTQVALITHDAGLT
uniref:Response regulator transcription factor n=1 Tax=Streptomyces sp. NBC_01401 TaxID=2903854 RepID=A0AAU3GWJ9_9ACTN